MNAIKPLELDSLDQKILALFPGKVVRKDLLGPLKGEFNVPAYVLEYLLGKYCASDDMEVVEEGLREVKRILVENYVSPDAPELFKAQVKTRGYYRVIDKVRAKLYETEDKYWAELVNLQVKRVHIGEDLIHRYDRMLSGGLWAVIDLEYNPSLTDHGTIRPFVIRQIRPIQLAKIDVKQVQNLRKEFSNDEWIDLLIRSTGLEPSHFDRRKKLLYLLRLLPFVERNYNLVELGPRNTGKSYVYREISPYSILVSGGEATVASLFVNLATGRIGMVGMWDIVAFDEVAGLKKLKDASSIQILKDFMESGSFSRGKEEIAGNASLVFVGNLNVDVSTAVRTSHLFTPFPKEMQDLALLDRIHAYLPGWELPKLRSEFIGKHYGFVVDYFSEILHKLREIPVGTIIDRYFEFGHSLNKRDERAVRKTVSGFIKLLHPDLNVSKEGLEEYIVFALEVRRRVKEQLKKMGGIEFWDTRFTFVDRQLGEEKEVSVPEIATGGLIPEEALPPGVIFTVSSDPTTGKTGIFRIEVAVTKGGTGYTITGKQTKEVKQAVRTAYDYLRNNWSRLAVEKSIEGNQINVQILPLRHTEEIAPSSTAVCVSIVSSILDRKILPRTVVVGDITLQGSVLTLIGLADCLQAAAEQGGKRVLIPIGNTKELSSVPTEILNKLELLFYADPLDAIFKALGL
ncbi:protease Lon-related BREX system protein BrxL [Candidatus Aerophobetes bacterium]|nr:protease Lon-related BREX system protein BrxL [Candidatus Aerophobetes bacterium]